LFPSNLVVEISSPIPPDNERRINTRLITLHPLHTLEVPPTLEHHSGLVRRYHRPFLPAELQTSPFKPTLYTSVAPDTQVIPIYNTPFLPSRTLSKGRPKSPETVNTEEMDRHSFNHVRDLASPRLHTGYLILGLFSATFTRPSSD
jgi:hypothetical protein